MYRAKVNIFFNWIDILHRVNYDTDTDSTINEVKRKKIT